MTTSTRVGIVDADLSPLMPAPKLTPWRPRVSEIADVWFASYVAFAARGLDPAAVEAELERRAR